MLTIVINVSFNNASGVIGGWLHLIITLSIPPDNTFTYVIARVFETFCGVFIAILVNYDYDWLLKHQNKNDRVLLEPYFLCFFIKSLN